MLMMMLTVHQVLLVYGVDFHIDVMPIGTDGAKCVSRSGHLVD